MYKSNKSIYYKKMNLVDENKLSEEDKNLETELALQN